MALTDGLLIKVSQRSFSDDAARHFEEMRPISPSNSGHYAVLKQCLSLVTASRGPSLSPTPQMDLNKLYEFLTNPQHRS